MGEGQALGRLLASAGNSLYAVIRTSDGEIRWMDVSAYLKRESAGGETHEFHELARMELVGKGGSKSSSRASRSMR